MPQLGAPERPVTLQIVLPDASANRAALAAKTDLQDSFSDLAVNVQFLENDSAALKAICSESQEGYPTAAWVSAFTYATAQRQCGAIPVLAVTRGRAPRASLGDTTEIVAQASISSVSQLAGQTFCRKDALDRVSWVFPSLIMASQGVDPTADLLAVRDYADNLELLQAIYEGECAAAALPPGEFENLLNDLADQLDTEEHPVTVEDLQDTIKVLVPAGDVSVPSDAADWQGYEANVIPYSVLVFPPDSAISQPVREQMVENMVDFFTDRSDGRARLDSLLDAGGVLAVNVESFAAFSNMVAQAQWDMAFTE